MLSWSSCNQWLLSVIYLVLAVILAGTVVLSPHHLLYDEPYHLEGARMLVGGSSIREMLLAPLPSAPGPLYPILHFALNPLTHLTAPSVRYVNLLLLIFSIVAIAYSLRQLRSDESWLSTGMLLGVPMTWVTAGMALTEIPAFSMASFSVAAGVWATQQAREAWLSYVGFMISGLFAGLAVIGRQTYLPIIAAFMAIAIAEKLWRPQAAIAFVIACGLPIPIFFVWGGLVPPSQAHVGGGIALEHGILAFAYLAIVVAIIAPQYYAVRWKLGLLAAAIGFFANLFFIHFQWTAATGISKYLPSFVQQRDATITGSLLIVLFLGFLTATAAHVWSRRRDRLFLLMTAETILLTATAFGITHLFSSRYVMASFPFVLGMTQPFFKPSLWTIILAVLGASLGYFSLFTYYWPR